MKKSILCLFMIASILSLSSCDDDSTSSQDDQDKSSGSISTTASGPKYSESYARLTATLYIKDKYKAFQSVSFDSVETYFVDSEADFHKNGFYSVAIKGSYRYSQKGSSTDFHIEVFVDAMTGEIRSTNRIL